MCVRESERHSLDRSRARVKSRSHLCEVTKAGVFFLSVETRRSELDGVFLLLSCASKSTLQKEEEKVKCSWTENLRRELKKLVAQWEVKTVICVIFLSRLFLSPRFIKCLWISKFCHL